MRREFWRLAWHTLTSWRRKDPPLEHPGSDEQWGTFPRIRVADYLNPEHQQDQDEREWKP